MMMRRVHLAAVLRSTTPMRMRLLPRIPSPNEVESSADNKPTLLTPFKGETFAGWAERYIASFQEAATDADLVEWDRLNTGLLDKIHTSESNDEELSLYRELVDLLLEALYEGDEDYYDEWGALR